MIFIRGAERYATQSCLIIALKANEFYDGKEFTEDNYKRLYKVITSNEDIGEATEFQKQSLLLLAIYPFIKSNPDFKNTYTRNYMTNYFKNISDETSKLYILFNIVEIERKYKLRTKKQLEEIFDELLKLSDIKKNFEDFLLHKYYISELDLLLNKISNADTGTVNVIADLSDPDMAKQQKTNLMNFISIRNFLLRVKILELQDPEKNRIEILNYLDVLYDNTKNIKEDFAIKIGIKIHTLYSQAGDTENCIKALESTFKVLHKEMLYGRSHRNLVEQMLYISGLLGYYYSLSGNQAEIQRVTKKISKSLLFLRQKKPTNADSINLINQYDFVNTVLKSSISVSTVSQSSSSQQEDKSINNYKKYLGKSVAEKPDVVLNLHLLEKFEKLEKDNQIEKLFEENFNKYSSLISTSKINDQELFNFYLYLYNKLSLMTESLVRENPINQKKLIEIQNYSKKIIDFTIQHVSSSQKLKVLFQFGFFKNVFNKFNKTYIYSFFLKKEYAKAIEEVEQYDNSIKFHFELGNNQESYYEIIKIKADSLIKLGKIDEAIQIYLEIIRHLPKNGEVAADLGISYALKGDKRNAGEYLVHAKEELKNNKEKVKAIDLLLDKL